MNLNPTSDHVIFKPLDKEKTEGGIYIPEGASESVFIKGEVVKAGPSFESYQREIKIPVEPGDTIYYKGTAPTDKLSYEGKEYEVIRFQQVMAWEKKK